MQSSRRIDDLVTPAKLRALRFISRCDKAGIPLLVTATYRDNECQEALYAQGRTTPGAICTNAKAGESFHQYRVALDVVPLVNGKPVWGTSGTDRLLWLRVGEIGESCELEWAGRWVHFCEWPHFQFTGGLSIEDFEAGKSIPAELNLPSR